MEDLAEFPTVIARTEIVGSKATACFEVPLGNVTGIEAEAWTEFMRPVIREAIGKANERRVQNRLNPLSLPSKGVK